MAATLARLTGAQDSRALTDSVAVTGNATRTGSTTKDAGLLLLSGVALVVVAIPTLVTVVMAVAVAGLMVAGAIRPSLLLLMVVGGCALYATTHLLGSIVRGRVGLTDQEAALATAANSAGGVTVFDPALDLQNMVLSSSGTAASTPASAVPGLQELVEDAIAPLDAGTPAAVMIVPEPWAVAVYGDRQVAIGSAALAVMAPSELRALIALEWTLANDRRLLRTARLTRLAATVAGFSDAHERNSFTERFHRPANWIGRVVERGGRRRVADARNRAVEQAASRYGASVVAAARDRESVALTLWPATVATWQRRWIDEGGAVRPYGDWDRVMHEAAEGGRRVRITLGNRLDPISALGWGTDDEGGYVACPPPPLATALTTLASDEEAQLRDGFDDVLASAYYNPDLAARVFEEDAWRLDDPEDWLPLVERDPAAAMPTAELLERQVGALQHAMYRRDATALQVAHRIEARPATETVRAMAAGVAWVAGDPAATERIAAALIASPSTAPVLAGLRASLRAQQFDELADQLDAAMAEHAKLTSASLGLRDLVAARRRIHPSTLGVAAATVVAEITSVMSSASRVWILDVASPAGAVPVLVTDRVAGAGTPVTEVLEQFGWVLSFAAPGLRVVDFADLEACARWSLDRRATRLATTRARGSLAAGRAVESPQAAASRPPA